MKIKQIIMSNPRPDKIYWKGIDSSDDGIIETLVEDALGEVKLNAPRLDSEPL